MLRAVDFESVRAEKLRNAVIYGAIAGLVFSLVTWGYDGLRLALSHGMYPWAMFFIGLIPAMLVGGIISWVVYRLQSLLVASLLWLAGGFFYAWLAGHVPFEILSRVIGIINPDIARMIDYQYVTAARLNTYLATVLIVILTTIGGLLEISLVDATSDSPAPLGRWVPAVLWIAIFFIGGITAENNLIDPLVKPVYNLNISMSYAASHEGQAISRQVKLDLRLPSVDPLQSEWHKPYKLILSQYDQLLFDTTVLVDFGDQWATCSMMDGWPGNCKLVDKSKLYLR